MMKFTFFSLMLILCIEISFSSQKVSALSSNIVHFGDEYIVLARTYFSNNVKYCVFGKENGYYWAYKEGELIHLKSSTIKVLDIDTLTETVELSQSAFISLSPDTNYFGYWVDNGGYDLLEGGSLRMISNTSNSVTFRFYSLDMRKYFIFEDDTCVIDGTKLIYFRLNEQTIPVVNCRNVLIKDTSISLERYRFSLDIPCFSKRIDIDGDVIGNVLELDIRSGDFLISEYMTYKGTVDSSEITLKLGEKFIDQKNNQIFSLEWSFIKGVYKFVGFKVYHGENVGVKSLAPSTIHPPLNAGSGAFNCLGIRQSGKKIATGLQLKPGGKKLRVGSSPMHQ